MKRFRLFVILGHSSFLTHDLHWRRTGESLNIIAQRYNNDESLLTVHRPKFHWMNNNIFHMTVARGNITRLFESGICTTSLSGTISSEEECHSLTGTAGSDWMFSVIKELSLTPWCHQWIDFIMSSSCHISSFFRSQICHNWMGLEALTYSGMWQLRISSASSHMPNYCLIGNKNWYIGSHI